MELRKEIEPQFDIAAKLYPEVLKSIMDYTAFCDENGDEDDVEYKKLEYKLHKLTGKDMSQFNLWEWWEEDGAENLAFKISLPDAKQADEITLAELREIVKRCVTLEVPDENDQSFKSMFYILTVFGDGYFADFLARNFKTYTPKLFQRHKDKNGNYWEYSIDEIVEKLWNDGNFK